jgi:hypothetical protein
LNIQDKNKMSKHGGARQGAGRPPKADEERIRDLVSPFREKTIKTVIDILENAQKDSDRLAAAKLLLAYDFGTPKQTVEMKAEVDNTYKPDLSKLSDDELRTLVSMQRKSGIST